ncbi:MAG: glycosyltransferase family 9 protein [Phycisphaerales bacterium]|nr:glycosyltransferase family 9 protein [Phycisphaerales bacterium]
MDASKPQLPRRILIIRPSALGDICRTVPVLACLKRGYPYAAIDWMVQDSFAEAVGAHPNLRAVVPFARKRFANWWTPPVARELAAWLWSLAAAEYDLVLDCQGLARSAIFTRATRAKRRVGYADAAELGWMALTDRVVAPKGELHTVERMLRLVEHLGVEVVRDMRLYVPERDAEALTADELLRDARYAVVAPTSRWPGKRWPAERFAAVCERLLASGKVERVVLVGGGSERDQCGPLIEMAGRDDRVVDRIGSTSVGGLMALIARSELVIANDSAALHMAVGFDKPLVGLYGPTRVELVGPYRRERDVIQVLREGDRFDHKEEALGREMMSRITVERVMQKALGTGH